MPISSCDENRIRLAQEAQEKYKQAKELVLAKDFARALEFYLFAFDNGKAVSGWGGVRLSYVPADIAELGEKYLPAKEALQLRRDAREELIGRGETDHDTVMEWISLNRYLLDSERELTVLRELQGKGILDESVKKHIIDSNFDQLLEARQYDVLAEYFDDLGNNFMFQIFHYEDAVLFPDKWIRKDASMTDYLKMRILTEGVKVFELALGIKNNLQADEIAKRILLHCNIAEAYAGLVAAAMKAGQKAKANKLLKQAKSDLNKEEYKRFKTFQSE